MLGIRLWPAVVLLCSLVELARSQGLAPGQDCVLSEACAPQGGLTVMCSNGICGGTGAMCSQDGQCQQGYTCQSNSCQMQPTGALGNKAKKKRARKPITRCPAGQTACAVNGAMTTGGYECIDLQQELSACGDCNNDCEALPNVKLVGCRAGSCFVSKCKSGYKPNLSRTECILKYRKKADPLKLDSAFLEQVNQHIAKRSGL